MFNLDFEYMKSVVPLVLDASMTTLSMSFFSLISSLVLAIVLAIIRYYSVPILSPIVKIYVSFFRGTPIITQLFLLYFGIFTLNETLSNISAYYVTIIALSLNASAYMCETIRASFNSVDIGQIEAAVSFSMTKLQCMRRIIFPQAIRIAIPSLFNSFIDLIKGTSIAFTIGVPEMMSVAGKEGARFFKYFEIYFVLAAVYWILSIILEYFQKKLEVKLNRFN